MNSCMARASNFILIDEEKRSEASAVARKEDFFFLDFIRADNSLGLMSGLKLLLCLKEEIDDRLRMTNDPRLNRLRSKTIRKLDAIHFEIDRRRKEGNWSEKQRDREIREELSFCAGLGDDIVECIDSCLISFGKRVAHAVYLHWSVSDCEYHRGILRDPQSFVKSIYGLFGAREGSLIERALVDCLQRRFAYFVVDDSWSRNKKSDLARLIEQLRGNGMSLTNYRLAMDLSSHPSA